MPVIETAEGLALCVEAVDHFAGRLILAQPERALQAQATHARIGQPSTRDHGLVFNWGYGKLKM